MKNILYFTILAMIVMLSACKEDWEEKHYGNYGNSVNVNLWDTLKNSGDFTRFVEYAEFYGLDTFIRNSNSKTVFLPDDEAFDAYLSMRDDTIGFGEVIKYHVTRNLFLIQNVQNSRRLLTLSKKFSLIEKSVGDYLIDDVPIVSSSPLLKNGKYYRVNQIVEPKPNLYQFIAKNNPVIKKYIDQYDSISLNYEESKPLRFNEQGQTVYDSVYTIINMWEEKYYAVSEEHRVFNATMLFPREEEYNRALDLMAADFEEGFSSGEDIPLVWQIEELVPLLLEKGTYYGVLDSADFQKKKLANIQGDSVKVDFSVDPSSKVVCSNGVAYDYDGFEIGDSLYLGEKRFEPEVLCEFQGAGRYAWKEDKVVVGGDKSISPLKSQVAGASNDSILSANFGVNYDGDFFIEFKIKNIFPGDYRLVAMMSMRTTGRFSIYVNDQELTFINGSPVFDTYDLNFPVFPVQPSPEDIYKYEAGIGSSSTFNRFDAWVNDIINEFGNVTIRFEYQGSGQGKNNGFKIDYISLIPQR